LNSFLSKLAPLTTLIPDSKAELNEETESGSFVMQKMCSGTTKRRTTPTTTAGRKILSLLESKFRGHFSVSDPGLKKGEKSRRV
jgi:hypothetical protein